MALKSPRLFLSQQNLKFLITAPNKTLEEKHMQFLPLKKFYSNILLFLGTITKLLQVIFKYALFQHCNFSANTTKTHLVSPAWIIS